MLYRAAPLLFTSLVNHCRRGILLRSLRLPTGARMA
jgi:hypothetical protein